MKFFFILCFSIFLQAFDRFPQNCTEFLSPPNSNFLTSKSLFKLKPTPIKVHLIPHSHMDIGWIKTYDETYPVFEKIMNSVFEVLIKDFSKSFVLSELAFFNIWWVNQTLVNQNLFKGLISRGQIEFVGGGWCMNDEATTYYEEIIDQMTLGHEFLKKHLNISVKIGWQIDTFGHSASQAKISSQMGIDAMILNRIDYQDKIKRVNEKGLEFMWKPFLKGDALFTGVTYYHYESPIYLCDDSIVYCSYSGFQNFNKWFKLEKKAEELASYFRNMSLSYQHNDILMHTLGTDFSFQNASISFDNVDKLINIVNANPQWGVSIVYSTVSKYLKDIQSLNISYHQKNDDFLPYADFPNGYWSGFYSNRPAVKYFIRNSGRFLQTVRSLFAVSQLGNIYKDLQKEMKDKIYELEKVMGLLQHHDTITGTSPQRVIDDFIVMAKDSVEEVKNVICKKKYQKNFFNFLDFVCIFNGETL